ncbi:MAG: hypothetical protein J7513_15145 [Solirubrobacteraceae bacterium]|nr:hypothetical protein [Solirubrobacteraceae bacterium]
MHRSRRISRSRSRDAGVLCRLTAVRDCRVADHHGRRRAGDDRDPRLAHELRLHDLRARAACDEEPTGDAPEWSEGAYPWSDDELYGW